MARVSKQTALKHAYFHLFSKTLASDPLFGFNNWSDSILGFGIPFYDVVYQKKDDPVIYVFDVYKAHHLGCIGITGSTYFGTTFAFLNKSNQTAGMSIKDRITLLSKNLVEQKQVVFDTIIPVVYSYPKIGLFGKTQSGHGLVVDFYSGHEVPKYEGDIDNQGQYSWSFWDEFPQAGGRADQWKVEDDFIGSIFKSDSLKTLNFTTSHYLFPESTIDVVEPLSDNVQAALLSEVSGHIEAAPPFKHQALTSMPLLGQVTDIHCAPASLQMIYKYIYGKELDQHEIAQKMQITSIGSTTSGQLRAYNHYFGADFDIIFDQNPEVEEFKASIEQFLPVKTGIRGHARAAAGWQKSTFVDPIKGSISYEENLILVSDPMPVGSGSLSWESEKTNLWRDLILLKRKS